MSPRLPVFALALLLGACQGEGPSSGTEQAPHRSGRPERVTVEIPQVLRGLPIGPPDVHGDPTVAACTTCHDGVSATNLTDYNIAVLDVFPGSPADSPLLVKPAGQTNHDPGLVPGWEIGSDIYNIVLIWIQQGALNN